MKICSFLLSVCLLIVHFDEVEGVKCMKPKGNDGDSQTKGCLKLIDEAIDEKLEELKKLLIQKHCAPTDELSCCCQNDTSTTVPMTTATATKTTPTTTTSITTTPNPMATPTTIPTPSPITTTKTTKEFLYNSDSQIYDLPSFHLTTSCLVPPHPRPGLIGAVAGLSDGSLVICGGYDDYAYHSSCHTLSDNGWVKTDSLQDNADYAAASQTTDGLVVTGGQRYGGDYLSTTQTLSGGRWTTGPQLPVKMKGHCQVTVRSSVLIAGGYQGDFNSADVFTLEGGRWSKLQSMKTPRGDHACAVYQEEVYAIGGYTDTVEIFNITSNTWREGPQLPDKAYHGQAVVTSDALYYIGYDGKVVRLVSDGSRWENVTTITSALLGNVTPAQVVTRHNLKC